MAILINKITVELYQEADNEVGSEHAEIVVNPVLIGLFNEKDGSSDHFYTFKSVDGFSFNDKKEVLELFTKIESIVEQCR